MINVDTRGITSGFGSKTLRLDVLVDDVFNGLLCMRDQVAHTPAKGVEVKKPIKNQLPVPVPSDLSATVGFYNGGVCTLKNVFFFAGLSECIDVIVVDNP